MTVLVTGATGYIGSSVTEYIDNHTNHEVQVLCRDLPDYFSDWENRFTVLESDIRDRERLEEVIGSDVDQIVHLAAFNDIDTADNPKQSLLVNGYGTRNVLAVADKIDCSNLIYFSTQKVYGYNLTGEFTTQSPIRCQDDYALTHAVAEQYCQMYSKTTDLTTHVVRPSNVFGAPVHHNIDRWTLVPATFCHSVCEDGELRLRSSGRQTRDFVDLGFVNESLDKLLRSSNKGHNIYNITSETQLSIYEVAEIVQSVAEDILGHEVDLIRESDEPKSSNKFLVRNNLSFPPAEAEIQERLESETREMIEMIDETI
jgi:UDP-glucose 4-epimerase